MKRVMVFASQKEAKNMPALRAALAAMGDWDMCQFEPFVSIDRSVALALECQPHAVLVAINLGGTEGAALKIALSRAGFVGAGPLLLDFGDAERNCQAILESHQGNNMYWHGSWHTPRKASYLREEQIARPRF